MSDKVVYLFGAGASFNAIPVVSGMAIRMNTFLNYYKLHNTRNDLKLTNSDSEIQAKWYSLIDEVAECFSIDTLARSAFLSQQLEKLEDIKQLLGAYILWEQIVKPSNNQYRYSINHNDFSIISGKLEAVNRFNYNLRESSTSKNDEMLIRNYDYRYESLFSLIADSRYTFDDRFSFLSWNYDNQVEIAINRIFNLKELLVKSNGEEITMRKMHDILGERFIKLNGSASSSTFHFEPISRFVLNREDELDTIFQFLIGKCSFPNRISFAWESKPEVEKSRRDIKQMLNDAKYFIVIGYSFPEYNRTFDKFIIEEASKGFNSKIIVQDTVNNIEKVKSRLLSIKSGLDIELYTDVNQFYIPI